MSAQRGVRIWAAIAGVAAATLAHADIDVGDGAALSFGDGAVDLGCSNVTVAGTLAGSGGNLRGIADLTIAAGGSVAPGAGQIALGGDFVDSGSFASGSGAVSIVDACGTGTSNISGATEFYDLRVSTATGKQLVLPAATTQGISHALTLLGAAGNLLQVRSSTTGQQALLNVSASAAQSIAYVNARDDAASGATIAAGTAASHQSVDSGNLFNWFSNDVVGPGGGGAPVATPTLGPIARLILLIGVLLLVRLQRLGLIEKDDQPG